MSYKTYCKIGAMFTVILGTLLHFAYDFLGNSDFVAIFSAVNESTWEHLKLLFFPVMIFSIAEYFIYGKNLQNFWASKLISLLMGMMSIVVIFYTYTGVFNGSISIINITLFIASAIFTYWLFCKFIEKGYFSSPVLNKLSVIVAVILFMMFWVYTFYTPLLNIFKDPVTNGYGI